MRHKKRPAASILLGLFVLCFPGTIKYTAAQQKEMFRPRTGESEKSGLIIIKDKYLFGPIMVRGQSNRIHMQFYRGEDHYWHGRSSVGYATSDDDGKSWQIQADAVPATANAIYNRFASLGVSKKGRLITLFPRRFFDSKTTVLYQIHSDDDGATWSRPAPARVTFTNWNGGQRAWMFPYGPIRVTSSNFLVVMAYYGAGNFVMTSADNGESWRSSLIITSAKPDYSEMGIALIDDRRWIAVSRIDGEASRMAQFVTTDAGQSWRQLGDLPVEVSRGYVAPTIDKFTIGQKELMYLAYCNRQVRDCWIMSASPSDVLMRSNSWRRVYRFDQDIYGRSGYQSFLPSLDRRTILTATTRERSDKIADIVMWRFPARLLGK